MNRLPDFDELELASGTPYRVSWSVWGDADELGTMNFLTPEAVVRATGIVRSGRTISLTLPLDEPAPGLFSNRSAHEHIETQTRNGRDDVVNGLFPQFSSQWDGLRHVCLPPDRRYYGGRTDDDLEGPVLGISALATRGVVGRGILLDLPGYFASTGTAYSPADSVPVDGDLIEAIVRYQGVELAEGDILHLHTGWLRWYLDLDSAHRDGLRGTVGPGGLRCPGLAGDESMARWLWNHRIAAVVSDNPAVEVLPVERSAGFLHRRLIAALGMPLGEQWALEELAAHCREESRYEFLLVSVPLNLPSGVGSPANAVAVF